MSVGPQRSVCRSCGRRDGTHEIDCLAARRAEAEQLQAECEHRPEYGVTRTTGDPLGPPCCGRCGIALGDDKLEVHYVGVTESGEQFSAAGGITARPRSVAFRPQRVHIDPGDPSTRDWVVLDIGVVHVVHDDLVADAWPFDRRKRARKIRQNRRKMRRLAAGRFIDADERVPESVKILIARERRRLPLRTKDGRP